MSPLAHTPAALAVPYLFMLEALLSSNQRMTSKERYTYGALAARAHVADMPQ